MCAQVPVEEWHGFYKPLWLASALLNSSYSYYWDIERDWDIQWFTAPGALFLLVSLSLCLSGDSYLV